MDPSLNQAVAISLLGNQNFRGGLFLLCMPRWGEATDHDFLQIFAQLVKDGHDFHECISEQAMHDAVTCFLSSFPDGATELQGGSRLPLALIEFILTTTPQFLVNKINLGLGRRFVRRATRERSSVKFQSDEEFIARVSTFVNFFWRRPNIQGTCFSRAQTLLGVYSQVVLQILARL